jgi:hypothetical protein
LCFIDTQIDLYCLRHLLSAFRYNRIVCLTFVIPIRYVSHVDHSWPARDVAAASMLLYAQWRLAASCRSVSPLGELSPATEENTLLTPLMQLQGKQTTRISNFYVMIYLKYVNLENDFKPEVLLRLSGAESAEKNIWTHLLHPHIYIRLISYEVTNN